ncbi:hypothetical protein C8Q73DRAFT_418138 [Cubamyces lactineus]|nr:hypothetical protein C8Q73DRAFT_418138 [Cubamyces lactineus]
MSCIGKARDTALHALASQGHRIERGRTTRYVHLLSKRVMSKRPEDDQRSGSTADVRFGILIMIPTSVAMGLSGTEGRSLRRVRDAFICGADTAHRRRKV